ncbi:hypothetical protein Fleli_1068 [Bernardetia litoralis DSM 6794]|uniref:Uncharacterized protein n=1 Tax=Bernardetia litoralis (strain ATCC 23117 / DSM 6794 / NBRC 15988 / NCIMB 1366 / Fx l1 / Sio-4) TaxID=880071 RepID=I4AHS1_BERLS|nr:hypothetical protein [Bernardetia litoralis]AFM03506.1 hypothetical protein Fleli_1068 [Bernardetia litoralis DSM 6794]
MKKTGICPKCNSSEIYNNSNQKFSFRRGLSIINPRRILDRGVALVSYICLGCGYVEDYLSEKDLEKKKDIIRTKWQK